MSSVNLRNLAEEAKKILNSTIENREEEYNKQPHLYTVNRQSIIQEALTQVGKSRDTISESELTQLTKSATDYCYRLYNAFMSEKSAGIQVVAKSKLNFHVIISANIDVYRKIYSVRSSEKGGLRKFSNELYKIFPEAKKITNKVAFDVGHKAGSSVAELTIQKALAKFYGIPKVSGQGARPINKVISLAIKSSENNNFGKSTYIQVKDESSIENQRKGREEEKALIKAARTAINTMVRKVDWANQKGSRSPVEIATSELLKASKRSGAKINGKIIPKSSPSKVETKLVLKQPTPKQIQINHLDDFSLIPGIGTSTQKTNWSSLINIINSRLPEQVSKNMGAPGLVYRTGRLANSVNILDIEPTKQGYPSIIFDYQRNPYDVFDRVKGSIPWNTPARDPRALVDKSIKEIVKDLAIGRFYTRRA